MSETSNQTPERPDDLWPYDAFLSYSTDPDLGLATRVQAFLEGIHDQPGLRGHGLKPLRVWQDQSGYRQAGSRAISGEAGGASPSPIESRLGGHLAACRTLLILWPGADLASSYMHWELQEFLRQDRVHGWSRPIYLAVSRGINPAAEPERFFSRRLLRLGLHHEVFFDLRALHPRAGECKKVRDPEAELLRLAVDLADPVDTDGERLTIGDLYPEWQRERERQRRREAELRRKALARRAAIASNLVLQSPVIGLALAEATWKTVRSHESRRALADVLCATHPLRGHLVLDAVHAGPVRDLAFLGEDLLISVDAGTGALNDDRPGALCVWDLPRGIRYHRDERLGGRRVLATGGDRLVIARGAVLQALRWYDDEERVGFRRRWSIDLEAPGVITDLAYEPEGDLIAVAQGDLLRVLRDGDRALIHRLQAPERIRALCWLGPNLLVLGGESGLWTLDLIHGPSPEIPLGDGVQACAAGPGGLAVLTRGRVLILRGRDVTASWPIPLRDLADDVAWVGEQILIGGGGANTGEPALIALNPADGAIETWYRDFAGGLERLAVSPSGRWIAAARRAAGSNLGGGSPPVLPLWDGAAWSPLPVEHLDLPGDADLACPLPGTSGFATASESRLLAHTGEGVPRWTLGLAHAVTALAACPGAGCLAIATAAPEILLISADLGEIQGHWAPASGSDQILSLTAVAGGERLLVGWGSGRVMLFEVAGLRLLGAAGRHGYELLGHATEAEGAGVLVKGGATWVGSPWVILHPAPKGGGTPHPVDANGVVQVGFSMHVGGWGWWDMRTDRILWSLAGALGRGEASLLGLGDATLVSPAIEGGLGVALYALGPGSDEASGPPQAQLSMYHGLPGLMSELLSVPDGSLVIALGFRELVLCAVDEPEPVARVQVPDGFHALTLTGDGARLIARLGDRVYALGLDPDRWAREARRRSGRGLSERERRVYLGEAESIGEAGAA